MAVEPMTQDPMAQEPVERPQVPRGRIAPPGEPLERATAKVRTSALSRHGIHRLQIVSRSRLRQLLEAAGAGDDAFHAGCLARIDRAEGLAERLRGQIATLERTIATMEEATLPAAGDGERPPVPREGQPPLAPLAPIAGIEARRLALIRAMMRQRVERNVGP